MTPNNNLLHPDGVGSRLVELGELADRCERAAKGDRDLELAIWRAIDPGAAEVEAEGKVPLPWLKCYTTSIDQAMSLVPEDMRDEIEITTLYQVARVTINLNHGPDDGPYYGSNECNSIPLAICAAALRALAHQKERGGE